MASLMSLGAPFKQFTSCMSGRNTERGEKRSQSARRMSFTWRKSIRRRSVPCSSQKVPDSWLRVYQAELKKERKRQQAMLAKKNAERTVRKTHFRSHHCLPRVSEQLSVGKTSFYSTVSKVQPASMSIFSRAPRPRNQSRASPSLVPSRV
ncbi:uncharacterized protein si:ch211-81a5.8 isoform X4 [Thalassophryne amazonica]|nr:uncharacterized protein si:ch211-81a5.8 isoform X4 [Thalassophryne amazonica]